VANEASDLLRNNIEKIMQLWEQRARTELIAAKYESKCALRDSLPKYLTQMADNLSMITDRSHLMPWKKKTKNASTKHGQERAESIEYTIDQLIFEYHLLREIIFEVIEKDQQLNALGRDVIISSLEQAVNDAATQFNESLEAAMSSEKRLLERKNDLEKDLKSRDEFLSIAAHELKTPLTSLKLQAQMFKRSIIKDDPEAFSKEKVEQIANITEEQVTKLNTLVDDMMDVSRIRTGKMTMEWEEMDLCQLIRDIFKRMKMRFVTAKYKIPIFETSSEKIIGTWDKLRLEQIITNLLTNAIRYGNGKPIKVKLHPSATTVQISVQDQGIGIAQENLDKIFDRFERIGDRSEISGLGLGLFIVNSLVRALEGRISVKSKINEGSTFLVELPIHRGRTDGIDTEKIG
jgi:signal transduction histidine kinase